MRHITYTYSPQTFFWSAVLGLPFFFKPKQGEGIPIHTNYRCRIIFSRHTKKNGREWISTGKFLQQISKGFLFRSLFFAVFFFFAGHFIEGFISTVYLSDAFKHCFCILPWTIPKTTVKALSSHPNRIKIDKSI